MSGSGESNGPAGNEMVPQPQRMAPGKAAPRFSADYPADTPRPGGEQRVTSAMLGA
ncbi:hypothetical protein [Sandarakinorhabdus glacialis]|uniref:hypothetical protein n=1 Tax=Sandarakinorhabdus glacialis TaxID=1614636 RepID=UPI001664EAB7|nr:hypothetical protein [Polymorphobacter glacialis]